MKEPSQTAKAHSEVLTVQLQDLIQAQGGHISFADYMEQALYAPQLGYYTAGLQKLGKKGDFITAPELGSLFAKCLATQCEQLFIELGEQTILEFGAGSGQLACDLFKALEHTDTPIQNYWIVELSPDLQQRQREAIQQQCPNFLSKVQWLTTLPEPGFCGVIIGNEVLDAFPVHRFSLIDDKLLELGVTTIDNQFAWQTKPATGLLQSAIEQLGLSALLGNNHRYDSEIHLQIPAWIQSVSEQLAKGALILLDYGFPRTEFYHPDRNQGTLMCHYQHHSHDDPFFYPGLQDITAHVDFTAVAEAGAKANLDIMGYTNLASFLMNCGLLSLLESPDELPSESQLKQQQEVLLLTSPSEMGELFKVIALGRGLSNTLLGFSHWDKTYSL